MQGEINILEKLSQNSSFMTKFLTAKSSDELKALFLEQGITITDNDIIKFGEFMDLYKKNKISDDLLDEVAGGGIGKFLENNWGKLTALAILSVGTGGMLYLGKEAVAALHDIKNTSNNAINGITARTYQSLDNFDNGVNKLGDAGTYAQDSIYELRHDLSAVNSWFHRQLGATPPTPPPGYAKRHPSR